MKYIPVTECRSTRVSIKMGRRRRLLPYRYDIDMIGQIDHLLKEVGIEEYSGGFISPDEEFIVLEYQDYNELEEIIFK